MLYSAFPDTQVDLEETVAEGDRIAMRITVSGTHEGEFMGIEPTGEQMEVGVMTFQRIEDGKTVE